jgi:uncharacterized protein (TIRG00374 family)
VSPGRWLLAAVSFAATIAASIYVVYTSWPAQRTPAVVPIWGHVLAAGCVALELFFRSAKIRLSAASVRVPLSLGAALRTSLGGDFGAAITPARSGAEPARFLILAESGVPPASNFLLLWVELFLEMLSLAAVVFGLEFVFRDQGGALRGVMGVVAVYVVFVLGITAAAVVLSRGSKSGPPPRWAAWLRLHAGHWRAIQRSLRRVRESVLAVRDARVGVAALAYVASVLHVLMRLAVLPVLVYSLGGVEAPLAPLVLWPLALFYGGVVAPVPGGGGFIEVTFKHFLGGAIPAALIGPSLVWWRFYTFYLYILLGALAAGRSVMRALREDEGESDEEAAEDEAAAAAMH